jgi:uncharacterized membrane protein YfhO
VTATPEGLLAVDVPPGTHRVVLSFFPPGLLLGAVGTLLTAVILLWTGYSHYARARKT